MSTALTTRISQALRPLFTRDPFDGFQKEMDDLLSRFQVDVAGNGNGLATAISPSVDLSETAARGTLLISQSCKTCATNCQR